MYIFLKGTKGWREEVQKAKEGTQWRLARAIPRKLASGLRYRRNISGQNPILERYRGGGKGWKAPRRKN